MKTLTRFLAGTAFAWLALSGCTSATPSDTPQAGPQQPEVPPAMTRPAPPMSRPLPPTPMTCDAEKAKAGSIGQPATAENVERARIAAGAKSTRVIKPGMMVTMDFVESRLNVDLDEDGNIANLRCG